MKEAKRPPGNGEQELREIAGYYDSQTEDEELAEWEAAWEERDRSRTSIDVPAELAPLVRSLVAQWESLKRSEAGASARG